MKKLAIALAVVSIGTLFAGTTARQEAQRKARESLIAKMGGLVAIPDKEPGVVFLNCQKTIPDSTFQNAQNTVRDEFHISCFLRSGTCKNISEVIALAKDKTKAGAVIAIVDDDSTPKMLVAPEDRAAIVNVRQLMTDKPTQDKLNRRAWLMAYRAFCVAMGAAWTTSDVGLMRRIDTLEELDKVWGQATAPEAHFPICAMSKALKLSPGGFTPYRDACLDGWAPPPTNAVQKAIWEGVKSGKIKD